MNKSYLIIPVVLLAVFALVHHRSEGERQALEAQRVAKVAEAKRIDDAKKAEAKQKAEDEARRRTEEHERLLREAAAKKLRDYEAQLAKIESEATAHEAECVARDREIAACTTELAELRGNRAGVEQEAFALAREVEQQRVERRNAELEIQRATKMFISRLDRSRLANPPTAARP